MIKLEAVNKYFNKGKPNEIHVINNVNLELPESGIVAIYGKSGCGKTTLLNSIGGLDNFDSGTITINGNKIKDDPDIIRNKYMGYIFQNYYLNKDETCFENVANAIRLCGITDEDIIETRVMAALKNVGMDKYKKRYPDTLSGGEQQRIAIARAIVKNPKIILADEPTGNLDENNTVMIMDLLKEIGKTHLVVLVTHEENLVEYYCNQTIEISDGKIIGIKDNHTKKEVDIKNKNDIYLGELEKQINETDETLVEFYGDKPNEPIKLKIVNDNGNLYIQINTPKVKIIDETSEIKLKEGVFKEIIKEQNTNANFDMKMLPPIEGNNYGKLYYFKRSVKTGFKNLFKKAKKKNDKLFHICLLLFAVVIVFFFASFGTAFKDIQTVEDSYNHNVFYVESPDIDTSNKLNEALKSQESGVQYLRTEYSSTLCENTQFEYGSFETFPMSIEYTNLQTTAVYLSNTLINDLDLLEGRKTELKSYEIVISSKVADKLIENSNLGNIDDYSDLIGLLCSDIKDGIRKTNIVGVVKSNEPSIFIDEFVLTKYLINESKLPVYYNENINLAPGEVIYVKTRNTVLNENAKVGETIKVNGRDVKIVEMFELNQTYEDWLQNNYIDIYNNAQSFYNNKLNELYPNINEEEAEEKLLEIKNIYLFDYYDLFYTKIDEYLEIERLIKPSFDLWLYLNKDIEIAKYNHINDGVRYYLAKEYKEKNGIYPVANDPYLAEQDTFIEIMETYESIYYFEYEYINEKSIRNDSFIVSKEDYIKFTKQNGKTNYVNLEQTNVKYILLYSNNPTKTEQWLNNNFEELTKDSDSDKIVTPSDMYDYYMKDVKNEISSSLISLTIVLGILCVCMYFIMKSSTMNKIKEIGIYRAIGVSKRNFLFNSFIETLILICGTVLIGYLLASVFIVTAKSFSSGIDLILYYPWYSALISLVLLLTVCITCGLLPIIMLLRKTPSEILSKYDI